MKTSEFATLMGVLVSVFLIYLGFKFDLIPFWLAPPVYP